MGTTNFDALQLSADLTVAGVPTFSAGVRVGSGKGLFAQTGTLTQNSTTAVSRTFTLPASAQIVDIIVDVTTAFNSGTSAVISVGTEAGNTAYVADVDAKTGGRASVTISAAQAAAMANISTNTSVVATVTPTGATSAGVARVTVLYVVP